MKIIRIILLVVTTSIVSPLYSACGPSGSYSPAVSVNTLDGAANVPSNSTFVYTFSQPVNPTTVTASTFFILPADQAATNIATKAAYDSTICNAERALNATITCLSAQIPNPYCMLDPTDDLASAAGYVVCLTPDIEYRGAAGFFNGFMATFAAEGYTVGGIISGLGDGGSVVLQNNSADDLTVSANGSFTFNTALSDGSTYEVTVKTQPSGQACSVSNGTGTITSANVTDVSVVCSADAYMVGGTVSGLSGTVVLQNNGEDDLSISANGSFTFSTEVANGAEYAVTVKTQPDNQTCTVGNGTGTIDGVDVDDVTVTCETTSYTVGGTTTWRWNFHAGVVLQNNGGDDLELTSTDPFTFSTPLADGSAYEVTVESQPGAVGCSVTDGSGTINGANVTNVEVTCTEK